MSTKGYNCVRWSGRRFSAGNDREDQVKNAALPEHEKLAALLRGVHTVIFALGTAVGAGETKGHGGLLYNWFFYPLFTRRIYADKNRQEELIGASGLDWIIVRPGPFFDRPASNPLQVLTEVKPDTQLARITRDEVADFVAAQVESDRYLHRRPFIGHA